MSPKVATSQNTVEPPLPSTTSQPSGSPNSSVSPSRIEPTTSRTGGCRWDVPSQVVARSGQRRHRLGPHLRRPAAEAPVTRQQLKGDDDPRGHCASMRHRESHLQAHRVDHRVGHAGRRRQGQGPQSSRRERDRVRCRRARLPHPPAHRRGGGGGLPRREEPPLHPGRRAARAAGGHRRQDQAGLRLRLRSGKRAGDERWQARRLHGLRHALRPRRRGDLPGAVLDDLPRVDHAGRRRAGGDPDRRVGRVPGHGRAARGGPHRAHQGAAVRVARQPERRGVPARRGRGHRPLGRRARPVGRDRRDLRAPRLRTQRVHVDAGAGAGAGRHLPRRQRRGQDVRHDRVEGRLDDRARRT